MSAQNLVFFNRVKEVNGLREHTYPALVYCVTTGDSIPLNLVSSYKIEEKPVGTYEDIIHYTYRLKFEIGKYVLAMILHVVYDTITYDVSYTLKDENNRNFIVMHI